ncbi:putative ATP-dependent RNA helicase DDX27 [Thelohanellus kitauei]|uniref:Putative ATP-dependent RNA helicase DDX27 n=1 Tax=Thelohanellus kitauei TaxID=669202 RepID=A0A0C2N023_THEKT|nr:putative ATP-dependent RNA helicase DDX27 [Thelohanellus kitauei]
MLFSATLTDDVKSLALLALRNPIKVFVNPSSTIVKTLEEKYIKIHHENIQKREALVALICNLHKDESVLIFCDTKKQSHRLYVILRLLGESVQELHGDMTQEKRNMSIDAFRNRQSRILVSTDLSARGLDIEQISIVINFDVPKTVSQYVHRVGRTARAGKRGCSITIYCSTDLKYWKAIKKISKNCSVYEYDKDKLKDFVLKINALSTEIQIMIKNDHAEQIISHAERELKTAENIIQYKNEIEGRPPKKFMKKLTGFRHASHARSGKNQPKVMKSSSFRNDIKRKGKKFRKRKFVPT